MGTLEIFVANRKGTGALFTAHREKEGRVVVVYFTRQPSVLPCLLILSLRNLGRARVAGGLRSPINRCLWIRRMTMRALSYPSRLKGKKRLSNQSTSSKACAVPQRRVSSPLCCKACLE